MKISVIEEAVNTRYKVLKWLTLGWALWQGQMIFKDWINNNIITGILLFGGLTGFILWTISQVKMIRLIKRINADADLKQALNDELHQHYLNKSFKIGFAAVMVLAGVLLVATLFISIPASKICHFIIYAGVLAVLLSSLIYSRS